MLAILKGYSFSWR